MISADLQGVKPTLIRQIVDAAPPDAVNLGLGMPVIDVPDSLSTAVASAVQGPALYAPNAGLPALRAAVASRYGTHADHVLITAGGEQALFMAMAGILDPDDEVLLPDPGFPAYALIARWRRAKVRTYALPVEQSFGLVARALVDSIGPRTRLVVLNTPSNPTGAVFDADALRAVIDVLDARGIMWLSDEVYGSLAFGGPPVLPSALSNRGLIANSVSKSHALMGWRIGWLHGPPEVLRGLVPLQQMTVTCAPVPLQRAALAALQDDQIAANVTAEMARRRDLALQHWPDVPGLAKPASQGAIYLFADTRAWCGGDDVKLAFDLLKHGVIVVPGQAFGPGGAGHIRVSFGVGPTALREGLRRLGLGLTALA